jgi:hypothetical protein
VRFCKVKGYEYKTAKARMADALVARGEETDISKGEGHTRVLGPTMANRKLEKENHPNSQQQILVQDLEKISAIQEQ